MEKINLRQLQEISNMIFDHAINDLGKDEIELDESYYWNIDSKVLYDPNNQPHIDKISLGDLSEDLKDLKKVSDDKDYVSILHFNYLSSILRYLAYSDEWFKI